MRYPVLTSADAAAYLLSRRAGGTVELESLVKVQGDGSELDQSFVVSLRDDLAGVKSSFLSGLNHKDANLFEARAARAVHERVPGHHEMLADPNFWVWLAVAHFGGLVEWRYGDPAGGTSLGTNRPRGGQCTWGTEMPPHCPRTTPRIA